MKQLQSRLKRAETEILVPGLKQDITIMHITDSHLTEADDREDAETQQIAKGRADAFNAHAKSWGEYTNKDLFLAAVGLCNESQVDCSVFTGDIIDFPTAANLDLIRRGFHSLQSPYLYTMGNHDWSYPNIENSDECRDLQYAAFDEWFEHVPGCEVLEVGGVNIIVYDNSNYQVTSEQAERIREIVETGAPCLLFMHIPLSLSSLVDEVVKVWQSPIMMGASDWPAGSQVRWMKRETDASTTEFCEWLKEGHNNILGIFCGHVHFDHVDPIGTGRFQYVTEPGYSGGCRIIHMKPV